MIVIVQIVLKETTDTKRSFAETTAEVVRTFCRCQKIVCPCALVSTRVLMTLKCE